MEKLTCSYGYNFLLSMDEYNNEPIMIIDLNIKEYIIHLGSNSGNYKFPLNKVINDKLYLNRDMKHQVISLLDQFILTTYLQVPEAKTTNRGFNYIDPKDIYGSTISIQESSNVEPAIWFGGNIDINSVLVFNNNQLEKFKYPSTDILLNDRLHLKIPQAKKLKSIIEKLWNNV